MRIPNTFFPLLVIILVFSLYPPYCNAQPSPDEKHLVFLTWSDYIDPNLVKEFETAYQCRIKQIYYETDEQKDEFLLATNGKGFDVVLSSGISIYHYLKRKWVLPLNNESIPNRKHIDPRWFEARPQISGYTVPYLWGTVGIAYRKDLVKGSVDSWRDLFLPAEDLRKKIIMIKDSRALFFAALKALGYSGNRNDLKANIRAYQLLLSQQPFVKAYSYIKLSPECCIVTGQCEMGMVFNGDALILNEYEPNIHFTVPKEGANLWIDYLIVMRASEHRELAKHFINFLHKPRNAARLSLFLKYATPNKTAEAFLPPGHLNNPFIYPDKTTLKNCEILKELPPHILRYRNNEISHIIHQGK